MLERLRTLADDSHKVLALMSDEFEGKPVWCINDLTSKDWTDPETLIAQADTIEECVDMAAEVLGIK